MERGKLINHRFAQYIVHEDRDRWYRYFLTTKGQCDGKQAIELSLCRTDKMPLYVQINCVYVHEIDETNEDRPILRLSLTDITSRKQTEDALQEQKARFELALESAKLSVWDWNIKTGECVFDKHWAELCGYPFEEIEPHITSWEQVVFPSDLMRVQNELTEHFNTNTPLFSSEYRIRHKSGALKWIQACGKVVQRDKNWSPVRMTGVAMSITQRKQMEERLRVAAVAFESQAGILITDANKSIMCVNKAFTSITGFPATDIIGSTPSFLRSGLHDEVFYQNIWQSVTLDGYWQGEIWNKRSNGDIFPVWHTLTAVTDTDGNITHYVGSFTDLTAQKQAETVLLDARQRLENQVVHTQEELEKIRAESVKINTALHVLLKHRENDKYEAQNVLSREVEGTVLPFLKRLKIMNSDKNQIRLINILENNLQQLVKFYGRDATLSSVYQKLTPSEIQVASMVKQGLPTKLIASTLNLSIGTIGIHRKHIRKKLGLDSKDINLYSYLNSLIE